MEACWECGTVGEVHHHHPVPKSRGGTRTIPLCLLCHGKAHGRRMSTSQLTKDGLQRAKARGVRFGPKPFGDTEDERSAIRRARWCRREGYTLAEIAEELAFFGYKQRSGKPLSISLIHRLTAGAAA